MVFYFKLKHSLVVFFILLITLFIQAQTLDSSAYIKLKFINRKINRIENDSIALQPFYEKLYQLQKKTIKRVNIAHIGDSHLQADIISGAIRQKLQLKFGNAGRGLIFPYKVAGSNEPYTYKSLSNKTWESKRNPFPNHPMPIGISPFTIETADTSAKINLIVKDQPGLGYAFTKFSLFHDKAKENYDITICDESKCERPIFKSNEPANNPFVSELKFEKPVRQIVLRSIKTDSANQKNTRIYGMLLENDSAGILYNMIGANGAEYRYYNVSKYFFNQLPYLNSDLIIVSLGTNEAYHAGFNSSLFYNQIDTLVTGIKKANPNASIILTTPPDSFRKSKKGRVKNNDMKNASIIIVDYCLQHNLSFWNFYEIMGGLGSIAKWYAVGLASKDRVHFSGKGYLIQGDLFYKALMNGYQKYLNTKN